MVFCKALIQQGPKKGTLCGKSTDSDYCTKHIRQTIVDKAIKESIKYCDISRGCFTVLEDHQTKCTHCLHKARIRDRKREDKKRIDETKCLDCNNTLTSENRALGKYDKPLRRCKICYEKLKIIESNRIRPERNYKVESFKNKYVIWNHYVKGAKKRGIDFTISKEKFNQLIILPCYYCTYRVDGEVNGIDRIDNNKGYIDDNVVTCCETCNMAKGSQNPIEFIDKIYAINLYKTTLIPIDNDLVDKWKSTYLSKTIPKYNQYKKSAISRGLIFYLSEDEFNTIILNQCYLCGLTTSDINKNGIDRIDNTKGYTIENSRACCGHCNILKKDLSYSKLIEIANTISSRYSEISIFFKDFDIKIRSSKIEPRIKIDNPICMDIETREYKPLNEIILPKSEIPIEIKEILEKPKYKEIKQWKVNQVYECISNNTENIYREFCEKNNDITKIKDWNTYWDEFVASVKGKSLNDATKLIKDFIEYLRNIRHNTLCYKKNSKLLDREDRIHWTSMTIVRAFTDSKLDLFKKYIEEQNNHNPDNPIWQKSWNIFTNNLEENKDNTDKLKDICSKFLTAQRTKRYRHSSS